VAVTNITPVVLALETASADLPDASMTSISAAADGFSIAAANIGKGERVILRFLDSGSASVITIDAGDRPVSPRAGLGALTINLAASDVKYIVLDKARHMQDDGTITGTVDTDATASMSCFVIGAGA
jgi:hypothetical protein